MAVDQLIIYSILVIRLHIFQTIFFQGVSFMYVLQFHSFYQMTQKPIDTQTEAAWKQYQQNVKKSIQYHEEQRRKQTEKQLQPLQPTPTPAPISQPNPKLAPSTQRFSDEQTNKILEDLDINRPPQTWNSTLTSQNVTQFCQMITELSENLSKPIWQKFTYEPLKLNPYFLTPEQLLAKNKVIVESRKGTFLFHELVTKLYLKSLPDDFQQKFKSHMDVNQKIVRGLFGWSIFGLVYIKINKNKEWSWVSRINHVWIKSLVLIVGTYFAMNKYCKWNDTRFATCFDVHMRLLQAHSINLDETFNKFVENQQVY